MGSALRATIPPRRSAAVLFVATVVVAATMSRAIALDLARRRPPELAPAAMNRCRRRAPRRGNGTRRGPGAAHRRLGARSAGQRGGVPAPPVRGRGEGGRALGLRAPHRRPVRQRPDRALGHWFQRGHGPDRRRSDPDVVGVYLNHNYWPPFPHDARRQRDRTTSGHPKASA